MNDPRAEDGNATGNGGADAEAPESVLIKTEDLTGEGHAESDEQQEDANDPGEFAGKFESAKEKDLDHVNQHDGHHEVGAPAVKSADIPAGCNRMIDRLQAVPSFASGGNVDDREKNAGDNLQDENGERRAAEDVEPARGVSRHGMLGGLAHGGRDLQARFEPVADFSDQVHGSFPMWIKALGLPGVGNSPALMRSFPSSILYGYSKRPRSGGPEAREPSS